MVTNLHVCRSQLRYKHLYTSQATQEKKIEEISRFWVVLCHETRDTTECLAMFIKQTWTCPGKLFKATWGNYTLFPMFPNLNYSNQRNISQKSAFSRFLFFESLLEFLQTKWYSISWGRASTLMHYFWNSRDLDILLWIS